MPAVDLDAAHRHSSRHRAELARSKVCGCFFCRATFAPADIKRWIPDGATTDHDTALCPRCGIDSVLGDASGLPIDREFLEAMHKRWFGGPPR